MQCTPNELNLFPLDCYPLDPSISQFTPPPPRLAGLEPIVDSVLEFDELRKGLEGECVQQQEALDQLPLLEVTEEQLLTQQQECHALLQGVEAQAEALGKLDAVAEQFLRDTEVSGVTGGKGRGKGGGREEGKVEGGGKWVQCTTGYRRMS